MRLFRAPAVLTALLFVPVLTSAQPARFARPELIVDGAWLEAHLGDANLRVIDMRPRGFDEGHVPGALWLDNNTIRNPKAPPTFLPTAAEFAELMATRGISNETRVVVYDERGGLYAARLWFILNYYGHGNVALLDGGWPKWVADGRKTSTELAKPGRTTFAAKKGAIGVATADDVKAAIHSKTRLIDARTQGEIDGKDLRNIKRGGFIESSIPVYWEDLLDASSRVVKAPAEVEKIWRGKGVQKDDQVIVYCQVGMRASYDLWTLALLGHDLAKLRNYYGAWEEWGNRDDTPIKNRD